MKNNNLKLNKMKYTPKMWKMFVKLNLEIPIFFRVLMLLLHIVSFIGFILAVYHEPFLLGIIIPFIIYFEISEFKKDNK